jgi:hypothetical protein
MESKNLVFINKMNSLADLFCLPISVHLGATTNIVFTILASNYYFKNYSNNHFALLEVSSFFIASNILPVIFLRLLDKKLDLDIPTLNDMSFFRDQHRFSSWVYFVASGNMVFWILQSWFISFFSNENFLIYLVATAVLITFTPLWRRALLQ